MRSVRLLALAPVLLLQGCFFVFIPASLINSAADGISGAEGTHCVSDKAVVGGIVSMPSGASWRVESLSGTSYRCSNPAFPIRARLSPL